jgi:hypothetical protein
MSNPNFVNDLVMMAKAFEELPQVKAELEAAKHDVAIGLERIQSLELRLIDRANELDAAHATIRKVEVERDYAERMFLETDDRLNAFRRLLGSFQTEAGALIAAAEPEPKPEPAVKVGASEVDLPPQEVNSTPIAESTTAEPAPAQDTSHYAEVPGVGESVVDPMPAATEDHSQPVHSTTEPTAVPSTMTEEVTPSVADPIASSTAGAGPLPDTVAATPNAEPQADASTLEQPTAIAFADDVGYHNEPDYQDHMAWDGWLARMNARYGIGQWPSRYPAAAQ